MIRSVWLQALVGYLALLLCSEALPANRMKRQGLFGNLFGGGNNGNNNGNTGNNPNDNNPNDNNNSNRNNDNNHFNRNNNPDNNNLNNNQGNSNLQLIDLSSGLNGNWDRNRNQAKFGIGDNIGALGTSIFSRGTEINGGQQGFGFGNGFGILDGLFQSRSGIGGDFTQLGNLFPGLKGRRRR